MTFTIRPATLADRDALMQMASRLTVGIAPWIDPQAWIALSQRWIDNDLQRLEEGVVVFIAESLEGVPLGFASVSRSKDILGELQAYLGELAVTIQAEGQGIGGALLEYAEQWAKEQGFRAIALDTGAANHHARAFYVRHGYLEDSVHLVKLLP